MNEILQDNAKKKKPKPKFTDRRRNWRLSYFLNFRGGLFVITKTYKKYFGGAAKYINRDTYATAKEILFLIRLLNEHKKMIQELAELAKKKNQNYNKKKKEEGDEANGE